MKEAMDIVIIGGGLGGLACAISCRRAGLNVVVLERAPEIMQVGAGIQVPSNGVKVLDRFGLLSKIKEKATQMDSLSLVRYSDGKLLGHRELREPFIKKVGAPWLVIHRADYHQILFDEAVRLGADIRLNSNVIRVDSVKNLVVLEGGATIVGDVIVGADGLWSMTRESILDNQFPPYETGELAYRATFTREELQSLNDPEVEKVCSRSAVTVWVGPEKHCVFYPLRNGEIYNLVLLRPDNLPPGARTENGSIHEMRATFEGWDKILNKMISCIPSVLKWKLLHHEGLPRWTKNCTALLGDACHPTLPYQAQGAAMAVEDGAMLGSMLGLLNRRFQGRGRVDPGKIAAVLRVYEEQRKPRTTVNVRAAKEIGDFYHYDDGLEQVERDVALANVNWDSGYSKYRWADATYQQELLAYDAIQAAEVAFAAWEKTAISEQSML